jgi:uncharacterized membrane protein YphA (DoxX/SURF4 family)
LSIADLLARLILAIVFFTAGFAKLRDLEGTRSAVSELGLPSLIRRSSFLLPVVEVAIGILLLKADTAWLGALCSLALISAFSLLIVSNLARNRHPECHCFGGLAARPISQWTVARNATLAAVALTVMAYGPNAPRLSAWGWVTDLRTSEQILLGLVTAMLLAVALQAWVLMQLFAQLGRVLVRLDALEGNLPSERRLGHPGLPPGTEAPDVHFTGATDGLPERESLRDLGQPGLLVFADPACASCTWLMPQLVQWQQSGRPGAYLVIITPSETQDAIARQPRGYIVVGDAASHAMEAYQVRGTPSAVLVSTDGMVQEPMAEGRESIVRLLDKAML